jgi:iron complex outermembrane receptor protein
MKKSIRLRARAFAPALSVLSLACQMAVAQDIEMNPVTVTASKFEEAVQNTPSFLTILTKEEIQNSGLTTVNEVIMKLGGVAGRASQQGGNEYTLDIMGFGDTALMNTVVVIDGIPQREADQSETRLSGIPVDQVERIEIQRGAASVIYGEGAVAGVINIITKASSYGTASNGTHGSASAGYGSYGTREARANLNHSNEGLSFAVSGIKKDTDGYRDNSGAKNEALSASLQFRNKEIRTGIYADVDNANSRLAGPFYSVSDLKANPKAASTPLDWSSNQTQKIGGFVEKEYAGVLYKLEINQRSRDLTSFLHSTPDVNSQYKTTADFVSLTGNRFGEDALGIYQAIGGAESYRWKQARRTDAASNNSQDVSSDSKAYFFKLDQEIKNLGIRLSAGYREEMITRDSMAGGTSTTYEKRLSASEFGLSKQLSANSNVYTRFAKSFRAPNADEFACALGYACSNTNTLAPQTSIDREIGWKYKYADQFRFSSRYYRSDISNEIAYDPFNWINSNLPSTIREGIDLNALVKPHASVYVGFAIGLRKSKFSNGAYDGMTIPMAPSQVASLNADWRFQAKQSISAGWTWTSAQFYTGNFSNDAAYKVPAYSLLDLRYRYQLKDVELSLSVRNLADKKYYSYGTMYSSNSYAVYPELGRTLMARAKYSY